MLTLFIYIPSAITMAAISDFFLSLLWGATAILSLVLCQLHCRHPQKQPVAVVVIYILRTFAPKLSIVTLVCVMFADTVDSFNVCEMAACHDLHRAPDTPILWSMALPFMRHRPTVLAFIYAWPATHSYLFFLPSTEKNRHL